MLARVLIIFLCFAVSPAFACRFTATIEPSDVFWADAVILGRVTEYQLIYDKEAEGLLDYGRFEIYVEKVLSGDISQKLSKDNLLVVAWNNNALGPPETFNTKTQLLFALRDTSLNTRPLDGLKIINLPPREPNSFTLLQERCTEPFIFEPDSATGKALQEILEAE